MRDIHGGGGPHPRTNGVNGVHHRSGNIRSVPFEDYDEPIDLVAVQADDELINALSRGMTVSAPGHRGYDNDDHVAAILAAWKADVDADPIPELVDIDTAVAAVMAGRPSSSRRARRHLAPVAAAAAFVVLAVGGVSVGSAAAEPGDALWSVSKVLYSERADSVEAAARVEGHLTSAKQALAAGQPVVAAQELQQAQADLAVIRPQEGQADLADAQSFLVAKAIETPPGVPTDPGAPLRSDSARKVPPGAVLTPAPEPAVGATRAPVTTVPVAPVPPTSGTSTDPETAPGTAATPVPTPPVGTGEGNQDPTTAATPTTATSEGDVTTPTPTSQGLGPSTGTTEPAPATS